MDAEVGEVFAAALRGLDIEREGKVMLSSDVINFGLVCRGGELKTSWDRTGTRPGNNSDPALGTMERRTCMRGGQHVQKWRNETHETHVKRCATPGGGVCVAEKVARALGDVTTDGAVPNGFRTEVMISHGVFLYV